MGRKLDRDLQRTMKPIAPLEVADISQSDSGINYTTENETLSGSNQDSVETLKTKVDKP